MIDGIYKKLFLIAILLVTGFGFVTKAEAATNVYYSVGQNITDHKTGTPTLTISGGVGTFSVAQTATNMGVGDKVTYNTTSVCYISGKQSTSIWNLITATGATCPDITGATVNSIAHPFSSLNAAIGGYVANNATSTNYMNTSDLVAGNFILNIPVYYDSGADTTAVVIRGYTTGANNYIRIYTATSTTSEVNQSQRHSGVWDTTKYYMSITNGTPIDIRTNYVRIDGLQLTNSNPSANTRYIITYSNGTYSLGDNRQDLSNSILKGHGSATYGQYGISGNVSNINLNIWNTILYNIASVDSSSRGINSGGTTNIYNSTFIGGYYGINRAAGTLVVKNTYSGGSTNGDYVGSPTLTTSASSDSSGTLGLRTVAVNTTNFTNVTGGSEDYRLPGTGSVLYNTGTNTSGDTAPLNFTTDIKNTSRPQGGSWDIGADEYEVPADLENPVVTAFTIPATATSRIVSISTFTATDNVGVTGYKITESSTAPGAGDSGWTGSAPSTYTITGAGTSHTLYAWAKDAYGNVSTSLNDSVVITPTAASCSYADVSAETSIAVAGDTVNVPAGSCTWNSPLTLTRGITLSGAGIGNTIIISNITDQTAGIIKYAPNAAAITAGDTMRITGFTFDGNNMSNGIYLSNNTTSEMQVRIDHNRIINSGGVNASRSITIHGTFIGVIDNNTIESGDNPAISNYGLEDSSWSALSRNFGDEHNIYYEDNTFIGNNAYSDGGQGGRYVSRYNTYSGATGNLYPIMDMHGNQPPTSYGIMVNEIYGNSINLGTHSGFLVDQRGGQAMVFGNQVLNVQTVSLSIREEYTDADYPATNSFLMHVTNSYYWLNIKTGGSLITASIRQDTSDGSVDNNPAVLLENREFWQQGASFDGTTGVGAGSLSSRPTTCTTGVGYWATSQSTTDLTGMVGANPMTPISGTLYKCTSTNTWTSYYTPYTYPHPLRNQLSSATGITSFNFDSPSVTGTVDNTAHTISLTVPYGTSKTSLTPTIVLATGATISPTSGSAQDFTNPVTYTVTAQDGVTQQAYTVTVVVSPAPASTPVAANGPIYGSHQRNISNLLATPTTTPVTSTSTQTSQLKLSQFLFSRNLSLHATGTDVKNLQKLLNSLGFTISKSGPGSPGNETTLFGSLTYKALQKFQKSVGLPATGNFGPMTKKYIKTH